MLLTEDPGSIPRSCRLPNKLSLQWKGRPVVKSTATSDLRLVRGGLRHPVSQVTDEIPPHSGLRGPVGGFELSMAKHSYIHIREGFSI